uniref:Essential for reactive oxygen species protein n=1 Tax=Saccoglossus kowalevskii TaxID=10224 RepID=A0ABM0M3R9_SACKO|nr:PREDICTED: uncharacterized protein C17orf62 homolog isoform X2 [Saccoglossus kowalevskii]
MTYMKIAKKSDRILHLSREPGIRAWSMFVGVISIGIGAVYFSLDNIVWTSVCILGSFIIAMSCLDDWEECIFNKGTKEVRMKTFNLMQKLVLPAGKQRQVVANLSDIIAVRVQEEDIKYAGKGHYVVLVFGTGFVIPIAERCTIGDKKL